MEWLDDISKVAWSLISGLGATVVTLIVTRIKENSASERLNIQLLNGDLARAQEREMALRREIYYGVIDAISAHVNILIKLAEIDLQKMLENISAESMAKNTRLQLIAGNEVLVLFHEFNHVLGKAYTELMPLKTQILIAEINAKSDYKLVLASKINLLKAQIPWLESLAKPYSALLSGMRKELLPLTTDETFKTLVRLTNESISRQEVLLKQTLMSLEKSYLALST